MGSGPGRAVLHRGSVFANSGYEDHSDTVIICLESETFPTEEAVNCILKECERDPAHLYILVAPTASLVGSVQIAARAMETGLSKLMELGYDLEKVISGWGICPIAPVAGDNIGALGRTNDAILYGSTVMYILRDEDENLSTLVKQIPSSASKDYGEPFEEVYKRYKGFYDIDPLLFSPAEVILCSLNSGCSFHAGSIRHDILYSSFKLEANFSDAASAYKY